MNSKEKIKAIWKDPKLVDEIETVLNKNNLSLDKLIACCSKKKQSILSAMGSVLAMNDFDNIIIQCECGEVMSFNKEIYSKIISFYGDEKILCRRCDPNFIQKLETINGRNVVTTKLFQTWE